MTPDEFTVKQLSHEIFAEGPSSISDSIEVSYHKIENFDVAAKSLPDIKQ